MKKLKETTATTIVMQVLKNVDDFRTLSQLHEQSGVTRNRISAALHMLKMYKAVECMESDGKLWWYATPQNDTRSKIVEERAPEIRPRKSRKVKVQS